MFKNLTLAVLLIAGLGLADIGYRVVSHVTADDTNPWTEVAPPPDLDDFEKLFVKCYTHKYSIFFFEVDSPPTCFFRIPPELMESHKPPIKNYHHLR